VTYTFGLDTRFRLASLPAAACGRQRHSTAGTARRAPRRRHCTLRPAPRRDEGALGVGDDELARLPVAGAHLEGDGPIAALLEVADPPQRPQELGQLVDVVRSAW